MVWSTTHLADMEDSTARAAKRRQRGRRRLRLGSLALSALMTMHCRLPSSALKGEIFFFLGFLILTVVALANPARHFEVYLGQWSISGPGRAFRMIPMFDGIGIAMCINAIVRAISCCSIAAIAALYVYHSMSDAELPFTYCRNFDSETYNPIKADIPSLRRHLGSKTVKEVLKDYSKTVGLNMKYKYWWNNTSRSSRRASFEFPANVKVCNETYAGQYPPMYKTPAYNYFYVEVVKYRDMEKILGDFNVPLGLTIIIAWFVLWSFMIMEKLSYSRLIYNNVKRWFILIPWIWSTVLVAHCASNMTTSQVLNRLFRVGSSQEIHVAVTDAFGLALYVHSISVGTELIYGKALHNYALGHIDPYLGPENVWHSGIVLMVAGVHACGAAMCALVDFKHFNPIHYQNMKESTLWIMPMYSNCTSMGNYSHFVTTLIFGGLVFSYMVVAFVNLKAALHTIFEYKVKLVLREQYIAGGLIISCMALSMLYATNGGIALLESVDAIMVGITTMFVLLLEVVCLMFVYRAHDFQSDMNLATEESTCPSRMLIQWQIIPLIALAVLGLKISVLPSAEMESKYMALASVPLVAVGLGLFCRAIRNVCSFVRTPAAPAAT